VADSKSLPSRLVDSPSPALARVLTRRPKVIITNPCPEKKYYPRDKSGRIDIVSPRVAAAGPACVVRDLRIWNAVTVSFRDRTRPESVTVCRLFLAPGVFHCAGGYGPVPTHPLVALIDWAEHGILPASLPAADVDPAGRNLTRDPCPYPKMPVYECLLLQIDRASELTASNLPEFLANSNVHGNGIIISVPAPVSCPHKRFQAEWRRT